MEHDEIEQEHREHRLLKRVSTRFDVGLLGDLLDGKGRALDLSTGGCRIESACPVRPGDRIHLLLRLTREQAPLKVEIARIRWTTEKEFGLEFIRMNPQQEKRLRQMVRMLELTPCHENQGSRPGVPIEGLRPSAPDDAQDLLDKLYERWD